MIGWLLVICWHAPRLAQLAASRAPSRAACVIMFATIHACPNMRIPSATVTNRTMVIPSSISSWPRWFRLCLIGVLVRCLSVWHSGSYSKGCAAVHKKMTVHKKMDVDPGLSRAVRYRGRQPAGSKSGRVLEGRWKPSDADRTDLATGGLLRESGAFGPEFLNNGG